MTVAAVDTFSTYRAGLKEPCEHAFAITPSDTDQLAYVTRKIWVGSAGNVSLVTAGGETVVFESIPAGTLLEVRAKQVTSANTTGGIKLVGMY
jgi:hypothetical protein